MKIRLRSKKTVAKQTANPAVAARTPGTIAGATAVAARAMSQRQFLKLVAAAVGLAGAGQVVMAPRKAEAADQTVDGNLIFTGAGRRILGNFSGLPIGNRVLFQTSAVDSGTGVGVMPSGAGASAMLNLYAGSDPDNSSFGSLRIIGGDAVSLYSAAWGTGMLLPLAFFTGGGERMRIAVTGNVGIGTTSPQQKLEVAGAARIAQDVILEDPAYLGSIGKITRLQGGATDAGIAFHTTWSSTLERMRITNTGNVGIGTTNPTAKLDVAGEVRVNGIPAIDASAVARQCYYAS